MSLHRTLLATLLTASSLASAIEFTPVALTPISTINLDVYAPAWGDLDGDQRVDLVLPSLNATESVVLRNTPTGFELVPGAIPTTGGTSRSGAAWADFNGDDLLDLYEVTSAGQPDYLHFNQGNRSFSIVPSNSGDAHGQSVLVTDFDGDGHADVFVPNGGGYGPQPNHLLRGRPDGTLLPWPDNEVTRESLYSHGAAAADFTGDGRVDLFVANLYGRDSLFRNRGDGSFERITNSPAAPEHSTDSTASAAWCDWDNDGDLDLIKSVAHPAALFRNDGGTLVAAGQLPTANFQTGNGIACADFDNDGWLDVLITRRSTGPLLFLGRGSGEFQAAGANALTSRTAGANGFALADYDNDGDVDVLMGNWEGANPAAELFRNETQGRSWLRISLQGDASQRNGLGADIRVQATIQGRSQWLLRHIGGHDSQGSQELTAHFGLGDANEVHQILVRWPSGIQQELGRTPANQRLVITEPPLPPLYAVPAGGIFTNSVVVTLNSRIPQASIRYTLDGSEPNLASPTYSAPFTLTLTTTVKARLYLNGFPVSDVLTSEFTAEPGVYIHPPGGTFTNRLDVTLSTRLPQTTLHYTLDGSEPSLTSPAYSLPIPITEAATLRVRAFLNAFPVSSVVTASFRRQYLVEPDGIPDAWREQFFGPDFRFDPRALGFVDPDQDGSNNHQEFLAGSDPLDATSGFRVSIRALPEIVFPAVPGVRYRILRLASITSTEATVVLDTTATGDSIRFVDESPEAMPHPSFYLVEPVR
jgi:hypothetical protein